MKINWEAACVGMIGGAALGASISGWILAVVLAAVGFYVGAVNEKI